MKRVIGYLRPYFSKMAFGMVVKFVGTIMDLFLPWILSHIVDDVVPTGQMSMIFLFGGLMLVCSILAWLGNVWANRIASGVARDTTKALRHDLFSKVSYLSCAQTDSFTVASLESRLTTDTYNIHQMVSTMQRLGVRAPILLLGGVTMTMFMEPVLTLVLLAVLPFVAVTVVHISRKGIPMFVTLQRSVDKMVRVVRENASGIRVIKALSKGEYERERFENVNGEVVANETKASVTMAASGPLMNMFLNAGLTLVVVAGAFRVNQGATTPGTILAFLTYFTIILNALLSINRMFVMFSKGSASAKRIQEVLDTENDLPLELTEEKKSPYQVEFDHVSFAYAKGRDNAVTDISFTLERGQTLGIIGATGSGKSTIINLLMRFYDPDEGKVYIDGADVRSIPPEELYAKFGVVFQNDVLFADTVRENISFGRDLPEEEVEAAADNAQAGEFINGLEDKFDHWVAIRGSNLSGGQKQRLLIARSLAAKPEILILDDASSALDYQTDAKLRQTLGIEYKGTTSVIVAQRVSSIKSADHILVMEHGRVIGSGTHSELMDTCPVYRQIAVSQMGGDSNG